MDRPEFTEEQVFFIKMTIENFNYIREADQNELIALLFGETEK